MPKTQPQKTNGRIGVGITTHNRRETFLTAYEHAKRFLPEGGKLVIVDDASDTPVPEATYRFEKNVGIATGKNKCLELLDDCEHIFLFDDDSYPVAKDWHIPYIEAGEPHLMLLFKDLKFAKLNDAVDVYQDAKIKALSHPRGCMLYFHRSVLDIAGGMDTGYARWGFEHGDLSNRIYNLGLTTFPYMDVIGSESLIYSGDYEQAVQTTVKWQERRKYLADMTAKYEASKKSKAYFPYKIGAKRPRKPVKGTETAVICSYLNGKVDSQRRHVWQANYGVMFPLVRSVSKKGRKLVILNNCFEKEDAKNVEHVRVEQGVTPYAQRWLASWRYLRDNPQLGKVCLVDATDVEMIRDPFLSMQDGVLYVGDEDQTLGCWWMLNNTSNEAFKAYFERRNNLPLLNCGVVCGDRETVMWLCKEIYEGMIIHNPDEKIEMPIFNHVLRTKYKGKLEFGRHVTTIFKQYECQSPAWFKHK